MSDVQPKIPAPAVIVPAVPFNSNDNVPVAVCRIIYNDDDDVDAEMIYVSQR